MQIGWFLGNAAAGPGFGGGACCVVSYVYTFRARGFVADAA
jgi:hypothetical protein